MKRLFQILAVFVVVTCCACADEKDKSMELLKPPLRPGQTLDPDSLYAKTWPGKPSLVKLKDNLILSIPPQYHQFWTQRHWLTGRDLSNRPPFPLEKLPYADLAGFTMHMPDFEGYTPDNYLKDFDQSRVEVAYITPAPMTSMEPDASGIYPPNVFKRISTGEFRSIELDKYEDKFGLRCYEKKDKDDDQQRCYGKRDSDLEEYLILDIYVPPYQRYTLFPMMSTKYFSPKYGGVEIAWRSHMNNFPHWREIDAQIWKYIDAWNIAPKGASATAPQAPASH